MTPPPAPPPPSRASDRVCASIQPSQLMKKKNELWHNCDCLYLASILIRPLSRSNVTIRCCRHVGGGRCIKHCIPGATMSPLISLNSGNSQAAISSRMPCKHYLGISSDRAKGYGHIVPHIAVILERTLDHAYSLPVCCFIVTMKSRRLPGTLYDNLFYQMRIGLSIVCIIVDDSYSINS